MMRLTGPGSTRFRAWIPLTLVAAGIYLAWPASDDGAQLVEPARPVRAGAPRERIPGGPLGFARRELAQPASSGLFASHSWYVAPPPPPQLKLVPLAPMAPPLPFTFLGSYARAGEPAVFFLVKGDRIFDVRVGDVLEKQYSVDAAENGQLRLTYLPLGIKQNLSVGGAP